MNEIQAYGKRMTVEEYIRTVVVGFGGSKCMCTKSELERMCNDNGIKIEAWKQSKQDIYDTLMESGTVTPQQMVEKYTIGISGRVYAHQFQIAPKMILTLGKIKFLKIIGIQKFKDSSGKEYTEPLFDIFQYQNMTQEKLQAGIEQAVTYMKNTNPNRQKSGSAVQDTTSS